MPETLRQFLAGMDSDKNEFLKEFGDDYGYPNAPKSIDDIRASEFKRLEGLVYLDHAGATLYSELQMEAVYKDLTTSVYGNPHSQSDSSSATCDVVREARQQILDYCNASPGDYKCIFTSGATGALKLVGEAFPWSSESFFMYTMENHNSVVGIREYALSQGASAIAADIEVAEYLSAVPERMLPSFKVSQHPIQRRNEPRFLEESSTADSQHISKTYNLFAFPSECNFSGERFSLDMVNLIKEDAGKILKGSTCYKGHWMVLVDAAKGCSTDPPDLSKHPADFLVMSFYKLFGYPTGLGALIIRNEASKLLKKPYFSGGTVTASIADIDFVRRRTGAELFEDGTISFLSIASVQHGFKILNTLSKSAIQKHTMTLATYARKMLRALRHENGADVCTIYGMCNPEVFSHDFGPIVSFNLKRPDGSWVGYREVEKLASLSGIQLRTGCFCNPGACAKYLGLSHSEMISNIESGHVCWDDNDIMYGKPTGAVRISFGYMSTFEDAKKFIAFVKNSFVSLPNQFGYLQLSREKSMPLPTEAAKRMQSTTGFKLKSITVFPIKSCGGFSVDKWPLCTTGLLHDREWFLKSLTGEILTQKRGVLLVESPHCKGKLQIILKSDLYHDGREEIDIHGQRYEVHGYDNDINMWFSQAVSQPCVLIRSCSQYSCCIKMKNRVDCHKIGGTRLTFPNVAPFLLISEESVSDLNQIIYSMPHAQKGDGRTTTPVNPMRFRPNLIVSGGEPYAEDNWKNIRIANIGFTSLGGCNRCQMINLDCQADKVQKSVEPLATLASYRRRKGKILFGILLTLDNYNDGEHDIDLWLHVGQKAPPIPRKSPAID